MLIRPVARCLPLTAVLACGPREPVADAPLAPALLPRANVAATGEPATLPTASTASTGDSAAPPSDASPRNWIVILADDMGVDKLSAYGEQPITPPTPRLDALAESSVLFRNAYANPVCSPSRAAMLTGRYGRRTGFGAIVTVGSDTFELPLEEQTVAELLQSTDAGWSTAVVGKWHLSTFLSDSSMSHANLQGFDHYAGALGNLYTTSSGQVATWYSYEKIVDGVPTWADEYVTSGTTDDAIDYLATVHDPFFLFVSYHAPHTPYHAPPDELYTGTLSAGADPLEAWHAMVEAMDTEIGRLLDALTPEQRATTNVVFMGDNGTKAENILPPLDPRQGKQTLFEGGVNVPLLVSGPDVVPGESEALVHIVDLFATVAEASGATPEHDIDGVSFLDVLGDPSQPGQRSFVYVERFVPAGPPPYTVYTRAVRDERYKLLIAQDGTPLMFDLEGRHDDGPAYDPTQATGDARVHLEGLLAELSRIEAEAVYAH